MRVSTLYDGARILRYGSLHPETQYGVFGMIFEQSSASSGFKVKKTWFVIP
jgi:hypothetical protein